MRTLEENTLHLLAQPTPFHMQEGTLSRVENTNKNCSLFEIDLLLSKGIVNAVDMEILSILHEFQYLNHFLIYKILNYRECILKELKKKDCFKNLRKLTRAGILLRYSFYKGDNRINPLRYYRLAPKALWYMNRLKRRQSKIIELRDMQVLKLLAVNQFRINLLANYSGNIMEWEGRRDMPPWEYPFYLRRSEHSTLQDAYPLLAFPVRYEPGWKESFVESMAKRRTLHYALILLLVEDLEMIRILFQLVEKEANILYLPDIISASLPAFQNLFRCERQENGNIIIQNISIHVS